MWIEVSVDFLPGTFRPLGPATRRLPPLAHGGVQRVSFTLRAQRVGSGPVGLSATSSSNRQAVVREVVVAAAPVAASGGWSAAWIAALAVLGAACVALGVRSRAALAAGAVAGAVTLLFWWVLIQARAEASLAYAAVSFLAVGGLAAARRRGGGVLRLVLLAVALLVANVVALFILAALGAN